jgi:hypothetical protein
MIRFLLFCCLTVLFGSTAHSQVLYGSQIDYKQLDMFKYEVRLIVYADCRHAAFQVDSNSYFRMRGDNGTVKLTTLLTSVKNISNYHDTITSCDSGNNRFGILQYTFKDTVDFNTTYSSFKNDSLILFEFLNNKTWKGTNVMCGSSDTIRESRNFAELNLYYNAKGSQFSSDAVFFYFTNQDIAISFIAPPNNGIDSMDYLISPTYNDTGQVLRNCTTTIQGNWNWSYYVPFISYYVGSLQAPYHNASASPVIGLNFDNQTSLLRYVPRQANAQDNFAVEATIFEKQADGSKLAVGKVRREQFHFIQNFQGNYPPIINGSGGYQVCEGSQLCFNITTNDIVYTLPPPAATPPLDTVKLQWDSAMAKNGATFTITNPTARLQTGQFCWTPPIGIKTEQPYMFSVTAKDNNGVRNLVSKRVFVIGVKQAAKATVEFDSVVCGTKLIGIERKVVPDSNFAGTPSTNSQLLDSSGKILVSERLFFNSNNTSISTRLSDTIVGDTAGVFILKTVINNLPNNCPRASYDTISIALSYPEGAHLPSEWNICNQPSDSLEIVGNWTSIIWNTGDTVPKILADTARTYIAYATNSCGDVLRLKTTVYIENSPQFQFADTFKCTSDTLKFIYLDTEPHSILWSDSSTLDSFTTRDTGVFWVQVDKRCGSIIDSFEIKNNFPRAEVLMDSSVCGQIDFSFNQLNPGANQFVWTQNAVKKYDSSLVSKQREQVNLHLANSCGTNQYYHIAAMPVQPQISINQDSILLCPNASKTISASGNYSGNWRWNTGDTTTSLSVNKAGVYSIENKVYCGTARDSIRVIANVKPNATILADSSVCDRIMYIANFIEGYENSVSWIQSSITLNVDTLYSTKEEFIQLKVVNECGQKIVSSFLKPIVAPAISIIHGNPVLCGGDSIKVRAVGNYRGNWVWCDGSKDSTRYLTQAGVYSVSNAVYCGTATDSVSIISKDQPNVVLPLDTFLCQGDTVYLSSLVLDSLSTRKWNTGSASDSLIVISGGDYWLKLTNECGSSSDTINITQKQAPEVNLGSDKVADLPFSIELKSDSAEGYLWSTGAASQKIQVADTGCYWVQVSNVCGTASDTICIADTLSGTGLAVLQQLGIEVYPNPVSDVLTIKSTSLPIQSVELVDLAGRQIEQYIVNQPDFNLQVSNIASGAIFLKLRIGNQVYWSKVLIDRR